jgi:uncharacterized protein YaaR (DUF327 family)
MERIDPSGRPLYSPERKNKKRVKKKNNPLSFSSYFENNELTGTRSSGADGIPAGNLFAGISADSADVSVERMLDEIHAIGERIRENANYETVSEYRNAVRAFIEYVVSNALIVDEKRSSPNILRQKKFTLIKVIDRKLERLASGVLMQNLR